MTFHSDLACYGIPKDVQILAASLCDHLDVPRWFWLGRSRGVWIRGKERFIMMCLRERLMQRYGWANTQVAEAFGMHRQTVGGHISRQARALFTLYPDLQQAVIQINGYQAGRFIIEHWDVAVRASCGETELRASG
jgi:hypothetical protein